MEKYILYVSFGLSLLSVIFFLVLNVRLNRMIKKYNHFMQGLGDKDVENLMTSYIDNLEKLKNDVHTGMNNRINELEKAAGIHSVLWHGKLQCL